MPKKNYYIISHGKIIRSKNTIYFYKVSGEDIERYILPVNRIYSIYVYGRVGLSSGAIHYFSIKRIPIHFFNKYGYYLSTLFPRKGKVSGYLLVRQAEHYLVKDKRMALAKKFVEASGKNIIKNLEYYRKTGHDITIEIRTIKNYIQELSRYNSPDAIMGIEGNIRETYYNSFNKFLNPSFKYKGRTKRPPKTMLDALISFGNSLLYATILNEIYHTQLNPAISYLHEPSERRFSLSLDISEVFKPIIVDRLLFKLINKRIINEDHFIKQLNYTVLNYQGKNLFLNRYEETLNTTIKHPTLKRKVSIRRLIRFECYKLIKHLLGTKEYNPLVRWW